MKKHTFSVVKLGGAHVHAPIEMRITDTEVGIHMPLDEFIRSLVAKVGNPSLLVTQKQLSAKLSSAAEEIITAMKNETVKAV